MMEVGNLPTAAENRSHFAMWTMLAAPLIIGTDVEAMTPAIRDVLANRRLIAIDQDPLGIPAMKWITRPGLDYWAGRSPTDAGRSRCSTAAIRRAPRGSTGRPPISTTVSRAGRPISRKPASA